MALCYLLLHSIERCLYKFPNFAFRSGYYGENIDLGLWAYQMIIWIGIILVVKMIIWLTIQVFKTPLEFFGEIILKPITGYPDIELLIVMIIIPFLFNSLLFWITDSFLKNDKESEFEFNLELLPENKKKNEKEELIESI